jgi:hypothetical protein
LRLSRGTPGASHDESPRYTLGPTFEVSFGEHLAVESSALYKRFGSSSFTAFGPPSSSLNEGYISSRFRAHSWEFPILGKYYFGRRNQRDRFFVATGYSFQRSWTTSSFEVVQPDSSSVQSVGIISVSLPGDRPPAVGATFGAGLARRVGPLTFAPTFRCTRWAGRTDPAALNQVEIVFTLSS